MRRGEINNGSKVSFQMENACRYAGCIDRRKSDNDWSNEHEYTREAPPLLIVNGQETSTAEFNWHLQLNRALTADYFMQTYHAGYSEDFWLTDYSGEIPLQRWIRTLRLSY